MSALNVAHIGYRVVVGQSADLHRELLRRGDVGSFFLIERLIDTGAAPERNTYYFLKMKRSVILGRIDRLLTERLFRGAYEKRLEGFYRRHVRDLKAGLIHAHFGMAGCKIENVKRESGLPLITTFYGVDASQCLRSRYWLPRLKALFGYGDRFIVLSEKVKERLIAHGCAPEKITVWNCLVDFTIAYSPRTYDGSTVRLLTAARFVEKKGYPLLLGAFASVVRKGIPATLTIVGYGEEKHKIVGLVHGLHLGERVRIIDSSGTKDFGALYGELLRTHHLFALASTTSTKGDDEAGPALSLVSAQAAGLPVVCTPFVGSERSVIDGETGFVAREDERDFGGRLEYLMRHPELWNVVGEKGSAHVRREFSMKGQTEKMVAIYKEIVQRR